MTELHFRCAALPDHPWAVVGLDGREALSATFQFDVDLVSRDPALPLDELVGAPAQLRLGERTVTGVVAEVTQGQRLQEGFGYRIRLVPRMHLLSLGKISRSYQDLSVPDIVAAVMVSTGIGIEVERDLMSSYPARGCTMQFAESPLAFVSRLLEEEGLTFRTRSRGDDELLVLSDHNGAFADEVVFAADELEHFSCRRRLTPRQVVVQDHDVDHPHRPLTVAAEVDPRGVGIDVHHSAGFCLPEQGAILAARRAEALRSDAIQYQGSCHRTMAAGQRLVLRGHFRADFNRDYLVREVHHVADENGYRCRFDARTIEVAHRPARVTPRPSIDGVMPAYVDAVSDARAADDRGRYRVVMPFDLGGSAEGARSNAAPLLSPDESVRTELQRGAAVAVSFVGGDPDRPFIAGAIPPTTQPHRRRVLRTAEGGILEMSGRFARAAAGRTTAVDGELPREQHLANGDDWTETSDTASDDDWVRFAVPHDGGWSYLRYGAQTSTAVSAGAGENTATDFNETTFVAADHTFTSKYIDDDGETVSGGGGFTFSWSDLDDSAFHTNFASSEQSKGESSHFDHANSYGVYDYTDGNRTTITQGTHQSITVGHRTDVVLGDYRLVIPRRTNGVFDADVYGMRYRKQAGHWRKTEWSHVAADTYAWGDTESFFWGLQFELAGGINAAGFLGGQFEATVALQATLNLGAAVEASIGDKFVYTKGDERTSSSSHLVSASKTITLAIGSQTWHESWPELGLAAATGLLATASVVGATVNVDADNPNTSLITSAVAGGLAVITGGVLAARMLMDDAESPNGYPTATLTKEGGENVKISTSADTFMELEAEKFTLQVGGAAGSTLIMSKDGVLLRSGGKGAVLLDTSGGATVTADGSGLTETSNVDSAKYPKVALGDQAAVLGFNATTGFEASASGADVVQ